MFTHTGTTELPYGVTRHDPLCDECSKPKAEHCATCEECPLTDDACWCTAETFSDGEPTPNATPDPGYTLAELRQMTRTAAPAPKLNPTQEDLLRYFAGVKENGRGGKPKEGTYAKLRNLGLIERCDEFPFHRATEQGHAWLKAQGI